LAGAANQREAVRILHQTRLLPQLIKCGGFLPIAKKASQQTYRIVNITGPESD
jgi:hypothetical protein